MNKKKIYGFKVQLNDKVVCRAGFEKENSVVSCIIDSIRREKDEKEELNINVGGLNSDTNQYVDWFRNALKEGDKMTMNINSGDFDSHVKIRNSARKKE